MKVILNDFGMPNVPKPEPLPGDTLVQFVTDSGSVYSITQSQVSSGISVRVVRKLGYDQLSIQPKSSNQIEII